MSSYHSNFSYLNKNSKNDFSWVITHFEADVGEMESGLTQEQVYTDMYNGKKRLLYGTKYTATTNIKITVIKSDYSDFSVADIRNAYRWLTGNPASSWLDLYAGDKLQYSFLCTVQDVRPEKRDARAVGLNIYFESISPWAYSPVQNYVYYLQQKMTLDNSGIVAPNDGSTLAITDQGVVYNSTTGGAAFIIDDAGSASIDSSISFNIYNQTDDLYTHIYLDTIIANNTSNYISIKNKTLNEETVISGIADNELVSIKPSQFITSNIPNKIFGDDFNFVWPRLKPGVNNFLINGSGNAHILFSYRYPIKIGDCAIDIDALSYDNC